LATAVRRGLDFAERYMRLRTGLIAEDEIEGVLTKVESYPFDFVFGDQPGAKAHVSLGEIEASAYSRREITAVAQFGPEETFELESLRDREIEIRGTLHSMDGFLGQIHVRNAEVTSHTSA
ncbi:MAG: hypothetical protein AAF517_21130, partial [Planctomycetota bacterium]